MVKTVRIMLMLLAALFLSRGPDAYGVVPASGHAHASRIDIGAHDRQAPPVTYRFEKRCSEAGCVVVPCVTQSPAVAILPDVRIMLRPAIVIAYELPDDVAFKTFNSGPIPPPPKPSLKNS